MTLEEKISNRVEIIEYNGYNRPLFFDFILSGSAVPKGLKNPPIKGMGVSLSVDNFKVVSGTTTYSVAPNISITDGGGSGAVVKALLNKDGLVSGVQVINSGQDYISAPSVTLSGGTVAKEGTAPTITVVINRPSNYIDPPTSLEPYKYVWVEGKGAYLTQDEDQDWIFLSDLTTLMTKVNKIYTINNKGEFLVNQTTSINDKLNQIRELIPGKGYVIVNDPRTALPYTLYKYQPLLSSTPLAKIAFNLQKCYTVNKQSSNFIDNTAKVIKLGNERDGTCMKDYTATISLVIDLTNLQKNTDYHIHLESLSKEVSFLQSDIYIDNNQLTDHSVYSKLKFLEHNVNNIFDIQVTLNIGNNEVDRDILSIYVDCPEPPKPTPTPRPAQPIVRIVE